MTPTYRAAVIGCGRMGAFIDNESASPLAWSHAAGYVACPRTELVALADQRADVMDRAGVFRGGTIGAGPNLLREALAHGTPAARQPGRSPPHYPPPSLHGLSTMGCGWGIGHCLRLRWNLCLRNGLIALIGSRGALSAVQRGLHQASLC